MSKHRHHIALVPGLLGFAQLGGFDYFMHVEDALSQRFADAGRECDFILVSSPPSGSIVRRAQVLLESVERFCSEDQGPIHFIGHSTGGLDIRLLSSPTTQPALPAWFDRVRSATSICTPHYGTPLAEDVKSVAGTCPPEGARPSVGAEPSVRAPLPPGLGPQALQRSPPNLHAGPAGLL